MNGILEVNDVSIIDKQKEERERVSSVPEYCIKSFGSFRENRKRLWVPKAEITGDIQAGSTLELTGGIRVKGNESFVFTVSETAGGRDYKLSGDGVGNLRAGFELKMAILTGRVLSVGEESQLPVIEVLFSA